MQNASMVENNSDSSSNVILFKDLYLLSQNYSDKLSPSIWNILEYYVEKINFSKGDLVLEEGAIVKDLYFAGSGYYKSSFQDSKNEFIKSLHSKHEVLTPISELLVNAKSHVSIECIKEGYCYRISWSDLETLSKSVPVIREFCRELVNKQYLELSKKIKDLVTLSTLERLEKIKEERPDILENVTQKMIANYLGITPVALSRLINTGKTSY
jgi:CRP-like cAMP-binding protein